MQKEEKEDGPRRKMPLMQWRVYKHAPHNGVLWVRLFVVNGLLLTLAAILFFQQNYFGAGAFVIAGTLASIFFLKSPPVASCTVFHDAIIFQNARYSFSSLRAFAVTRDRLVLFPKKKRGGEIVQIPIEPEEREDIELLLEQRLAQQEYEETLQDALHNFFRI